MPIEIHGTCDPAFNAVRLAMADNFADGGEVGEAVAVWADGKPVVDLWAGHCDAARRKPWQRNTIAAGLKEQFGLFNASYSLALIAAACADRGLKDKGLGACEQAFEFVEQTNERTYEAEIHRVNGLLLAPALGGDAEAAEACFVRALEVARSQSAKTLELRAANDLARMWHEHGRSEEARDMLEPVYGWFTEGFDTANLKTAKALLDELC